MIPKIVHYCWLSGEPYPEGIQRCIDSWHKYLPDYEFRLWDMNAVKDIDNVFLQEALQERVWAFAVDYVRLYALYHFGGIYLIPSSNRFKEYRKNSGWTNTNNSFVYEISTNTNIR